MSTQARERPSETGEESPTGPADVRLEGIRKTFNEVVAVENVDLEIQQGEFFSLLGPSGSGKTTLLRVIAGFERPDSGLVHLRGVDVTNRPPYARDVNTVFQDYALFPHMTVGENVEYGLRVRGVARKERSERAASALDMVRLPGYGKRKRKNTAGFAGSIGITDCVFVWLPATSLQRLPMPTLKALVCVCKIQPIWDSGQVIVSRSPLTLHVRLVGMLLTPLDTTRLLVALPS